MANFRQIGGKRFKKGRDNESGNRGENRPFFARKNRESFGNNEHGPVTMHQATCAQCGKSCEVPFRPAGGKPIYCRDCFQEKKPEISRGRERFSPRNYNDQRFTRPGFRSNSGNSSQNELGDQLKALSAKIDRLTDIIEALANNKPRNTKKD